MKTSSADKGQFTKHFNKLVMYKSTGRYGVQPPVLMEMVQVIARLLQIPSIPFIISNNFSFLSSLDALGVTSAEPVKPVTFSHVIFGFKNKKRLKSTDVLDSSLQKIWKDLNC